MSDNKDIRGPQDAGKINMNEDYEVRYWTKRFGVKEDVLKEAVATVGVSVQAVEAHLSKTDGKKSPFMS